MWKAVLIKSHLLLHQKIHTGEKPCICNDCRKGFTQKDSFIVQQETFTLENPCICSKCGQSFIQKLGLISHQRFHIDKTPFVCSECGRSCSQKSCVITCQKIHKGEMTPECSECGKAFIGSHSSLYIKECITNGTAFVYKPCVIKHEKIQGRNVNSVKVENPCTKNCSFLQVKL